METVTINVNFIQWLLFIVGTGYYVFKMNKIGNRPGYLSGIDGILPTFFYMIFLIAWLILFFVIL